MYMYIYDIYLYSAASVSTLWKVCELNIRPHLALSPKICRIGFQARDPGRLDVAVQVQRLSAAEFPPAQGRLVFILVRPSADWMRPSHITEGRLLYSKSTD